MPDNETLHAGAVIRLNVATNCLQGLALPIEAVTLNLPHEIQRLRALAVGNPAADDLLGIADSLAEELARLAGHGRLIRAALLIALGAQNTIPSELATGAWYREGSSERILAQSTPTVPRLDMEV